MEAFLKFVAALVAAFRERDRRSPLGRVGGPTAPARAAAPGAVVIPRPARAVDTVPRSASGAAPRDHVATVPPPEAGVVRGLFASPASLGAAFILSEILAKPVALRER